MLLALYSTVSALAYNINERYYGGLHWIWAAPAPPFDRSMGYNPDSSNPWALYRRFQADITKREGHSDLIDRNRTGIVRGAQSRYGQGQITAAQRDAIQETAETADRSEFHPMFIVLPYAQVELLAQEVGISQRASILSQEYIVADLPRTLFDVWSES
ncbi:hypothetical protein [Sphingomonas sp. SUN039]|uniref:hypothetical protein n=1 Tax=Sphingomonas sp. SUN039 TaxID=2937787 RepID=UPI002164B0D2|nr:hypothetical protein [Sphingomonas sp. SUN039]UVO53379.1 hypothetical protein M0209_04305 [Sphingomonas sp. SUN039]